MVCGRDDASLCGAKRGGNVDLKRAGGIVASQPFVRRVEELDPGTFLPPKDPTKDMSDCFVGDILYDLSRTENGDRSS